MSAYRGFLLWLGEVSERCRSPTKAILVTGVLYVSILATYSFTDCIRVLSEMAPMGIVFTITTFVAAIFPCIKREPMKLRLIVFIK